jgi:hypothetical protein
MLISEVLAVSRRLGVHVESINLSNFTLIYFNLGERHHHDRSPQDQGNDLDDLPRANALEEHHSTTSGGKLKSVIAAIGFLAGLVSPVFARKRPSRIWRGCSSR